MLGLFDVVAANIFKVTVESFHLTLFSEHRKLNTNLTSRFLRHIGQSLRRLIINVPVYRAFSTVSCHYDPVDFSQCVNVRVLYFRVIELGEPTWTPSMLLTMWNLLSDLPPNSIEEIFLTFKLRRVTVLESFTWLELIARLRKMFRYLKRIIIRLMTSPIVKRHFPSFLRSSRQAGLRQLEEEGVVSFSLGIFCEPDGEPNWRETINGF